MHKMHTTYCCAVETSHHDHYKLWYPLRAVSGVASLTGAVPEAGAARPELLAARLELLVKELRVTVLAKDE